MLSSFFAFASSPGGKWYLIILISLILSEVEHHLMSVRAVVFPFLKTVHVFCPFLFSMCSLLISRNCLYIKEICLL